MIKYLPLLLPTLALAQDLPITTELHDPVLAERFGWIEDYSARITCYESDRGYWTTTLVIDTGDPVDGQGYEFYFLISYPAGKVALWGGSLDSDTKYFSGHGIGAVMDAAAQGERIRIRRYDWGYDMEDPYWLTREAWVAAARDLLALGCRDPYVEAVGRQYGDDLPPVENSVDLNMLWNGFLLEIPSLYFFGYRFEADLRLEGDACVYRFENVKLLDQ